MRRIFLLFILLLAACDSRSTFTYMKRDPQGSYLEKGEPRRFEKGEIMPTLNVRHRHSRFLLADRFTVEKENIEWRLLGEA